MILIGRDLSPFVRRCAISLSVLELPHERRQLSTADHAEEILSFNPLGRVPSLVLGEGQPALVDSWAILDYLDQQVAPERALVPREGEARTEVMRLTAIGAGTMDKTVASFYERKRRPKETVHQPWADHLDGQVAGGLAALDEAADGREWLVGGAMTQADISAAVLWDFAAYVARHVATPDRFPHLEAHAGRLAKHPAFQATSLEQYRS